MIRQAAWNALHGAIGLRPPEYTRSIARPIAQAYQLDVSTDVSGGAGPLCATGRVRGNRETPAHAKRACAVAIAKRLVFRISVLSIKAQFAIPRGRFTRESEPRAKMVGCAPRLTYPAEARRLGRPGRHRLPIKQS